MGGCCSSPKRNQDSKKKQDKVLDDRTSRMSSASVSASVAYSEGDGKSAKQQRKSKEETRKKAEVKGFVKKPDALKEAKKQSPPPRLRITHDEVLDHCSLEDD